MVFVVRDSDNQVLLTLTNDEGVELNGPEGVIDIHLLPSQTRPTWRVGKYELSVEFENGDKDTWLWGSFRGKGV